MINFKQYLTEVFDTKFEFEDVGLNQFTSDIAGSKYKFSFEFNKRNGITYMDLSFHKDGSDENDKNMPFKVFAAAKQLLTKYIIKYPRYGISFVGDKRRERLYTRFAKEISKSIGGGYTKKMVNNNVLYFISHHEENSFVNL